VWDSWRSAIGRHALVTDSDQAATDLIALHPGEGAEGVATPPWLA